MWRKFNVGQVKGSVSVSVWSWPRSGAAGLGSAENLDGELERVDVLLWSDHEVDVPISCQYIYITLSHELIEVMIMIYKCILMWSNLINSWLKFDVLLWSGLELMVVGTKRNWGPILRDCMVPRSLRGSGWQPSSLPPMLMASRNSYRKLWCAKRLTGCSTA